MPMPGMFTSVRELTLHTIYPSAYELARLLHALPGLRALHFRSMIFAELDFSEYAMANWAAMAEAAESVPYQ